MFFSLLIFFSSQKELDEGKWVDVHNFYGVREIESLENYN